MKALDEWKFVQGGSGDNPTWNVRVWPEPVAAIYVPGVADMAEMDRVTRLLAAAPLLLDAVKHVHRWHDQLSPRDVEMLRGVIAAATGAKA